MRNSDTDPGLNSNNGLKWAICSVRSEGGAAAAGRSMLFRHAPRVQRAAWHVVLAARFSDRKAAAAVRYWRRSFQQGPENPCFSLQVRVG